MNKNPLNMVAPADVYRARRRELAASLKKPIVIASGEGRARNLPTMTHPFRAGSTYLYFGGPPIAGAAFWIEPGSDGDAGARLLRPCFGFDDIVWVGEVPGDDVLSAASGAEVSRLETPDRLSALCANRTVSHVCPPCPRTLAWLTGAGAHAAGEDELSVIISLRLAKDEHELDAMRRAADVTVRAHEAGMRATKLGIAEASVTAALYAEYIANQCAPSFTPIVSVRGEVLHSETYANQLSKDDLLLVDSGAEEPGGYACDVTRTYPCNGRFSSIQRQLYDTVLAAERAAMAACLPGRRYRDVHDVAARVVCEGLVEADILRGNPDELVQRRAHTLFFTHGVGHLIGLDVHDMEDFGDLAGYATGRKRRTEFGNCFLRLDRDLEAGMVVTIEPGIYLVPAIWARDELIQPLADVVNRPAVDRLLASGFGGIRIEDCVHVRSAEKGGPEILSAALASDGDAVCAIVNGA